MKPKEYLLKHGHISAIGRGRMSAAHIAIITEAVKNGESIEGYSISTAPAAAPVAAKTPVVQSAKNPVHPLYRYSLSDTVVEVESGKTRSIREACQRSGNSVVGCFTCDDGVHRIVGVRGNMSVSVKVER